MGLGLHRGGREFMGRWEEQMPGTQMQRSLSAVKRSYLSQCFSPGTSTSISNLLGSQGGGKKKNFLWFLLLTNNDSKIIFMRKRQIFLPDSVV